RFLVLERDSNAGDNAKIKRIYLADASGATDITQASSMRQGPPEGTVVIRKTLLIDLLNPAYGFSGSNAPEKPEGIAWGPKLPDGRRLLMLCFDNDFEPANPTIFAAFAVSL
ncbi:MAG: esterase-like activity of phytase family protein, partial [Pirellula sp.]